MSSKIRRQQPTNCLNVFDHFVGLTFKGLTDCWCKDISLEK